MIRCIFGIGLPVAGIILGFTLSGGRVGSLFHAAELIIVLGFVLGGLITAYGFSDIRKMISSALTSGEPSVDRLRVNIMICEGGSKFSLYGGFVACVLGVIVTLAHMGGDVNVTGAHYSAAATGLILGAATAGIIFQPLKFRFLNLLNEREEFKQSKPENQNEKAMS